MYLWAPYARYQDMYLPGIKGVCSIVHQEGGLQLRTDTTIGRPGVL